MDKEKLTKTAQKLLDTLKKYKYAALVLVIGLALLLIPFGTEEKETPQPEEELVRRELEHTINALLGQLSERQQRLLRLRFGMEDDVCYSLEAIGKMLGVSKERARQIEHQALDKLQQLGEGLGLEDFLN